MIGSMNEMAYVFQAWLPLLVWQQVDAPEYRKGFITVACISLALVIITFVIRRLHHLENGRRYVIATEEHYMAILPMALVVLTSLFRIRNNQRLEAEDSLSNSLPVSPVGTQEPQKL